MANAFDKLFVSLKNNPLIIIVSFTAFVGFIVSGNHLYEDYISSKYGIIEIEKYFNLVLTDREFTKVTMALTPEILQVLATYMFLSDTINNRKWLLAGLFGFAIDFFPDLWYRAGGDPFSSLGTFGGSAFFAIAYFTLGSNILFSLSWGIFISTLPNAISVLIKNVENLWKSINGDQSNQNQQNQNQRFQPTNETQRFQRFGENPQKPTQKTHENTENNPFSGVKWSELTETEKQIMGYARNVYTRTGSVPGPTEVSKKLNNGKDTMKGTVSKLYKRFGINAG